MALGTNYARGQTPKQDRERFVAIAKTFMQNGETVEDALQNVRSEHREYQRPFFEQAHNEIAKARAAQ